jgi:hypothetical protein
LGGGGEPPRILVAIKTGAAGHVLKESVAALIGTGTVADEDPDQPLTIAATVGLMTVPYLPSVDRLPIVWPDQQRALALISITPRHPDA